MEIFIFFIIIIVVYWLFTSKNKGAIGESKVARILNKLHNEEYKVINDILVKTNRGSSQIDHIVVSIYGIFIVETKNYSGWIHGNEKSEYWTQSIYKKKTKFRNPVKQNWSHIYTLKEVLSEYRQIAYHPIIVFVGNAELKNVSSKIPIIYGSELLRTITDERETPNLSIKQVNDISEKLNELKIQDRQARKEHIHQIQSHAHDRRQKEKSLVCPRCGKNLATRNGPYGDFYGCTSYPKCKYTRNT